MKRVTAGSDFVQAHNSHSISGLEFTGVLTVRIREAAGFVRNSNIVNFFSSDKYNQF